MTTFSRPGSSQALKRAHAASAHDQWFREQVAEGIEQANDPATQWVSNEAVKAVSAQRRATWRGRSA
ncbi:MAG: hypothetical protein EPN61_15300 [Burkholderiaceae bacterium]|nr:MAG: hypothetical protein EPN61_15300 [Burkholderiaceae bacterium]